MNKHFYLFALLMGGLLFLSCGSQHTENDGHEHAASEASPESLNPATEDNHEQGVITLSDTQAVSLGLRYETTVPATFSEIIRTSGVLEAAPGDQSTVVATTSGIVHFGTPLTEGTPVAKGSTLLVLKSGEMVEGNYPQQLADARIALNKADSDLARAESLSGSKVITASEREAMQLTAETARRRVEVLARNATADGKGIIAPRSGFVVSLAVSEGDYVTAGQLLATVAANRNLVLRADLPQRHSAAASAIRSARFTTPYDGISHNLSELNGRLMATARALSPEGTTLPIRFEFENRSSLTAGTVVEVYLCGAARSVVLTVPLTALTEEQGTYYLYLRTSPGHYRKQAVQTGPSDGHRIEITSGLTAGNEVVAVGAYYLRLAALSTAIPSGHAH